MFSYRNAGLQVICSLMLISQLFAQNTNQQAYLPGDLTGDLVFEQIIGSGKVLSTTRKSLTGKVIVLEFWATWCAPCIAAMPKIHSLAEKYKNREIRFISVTDENIETVSKFMLRKPFNTWVALDTDRSVFSSFGINSLPKMVILDKQGKYIYSIDPRELNEEILEQVIQERGIEQKSNPIVSPSMNSDAVTSATSTITDSQAIYLKISQATPGNTYSNIGKRKIEARNISLQRLLGELFNYTNEKVVIAEDLRPIRFDIMAETKNANGNEFRNLLAEILASTFGVNAKIEERETSVYVLTKNSRGFRLKVNNQPVSRISDDDGVIAGLSGQVSGLVNQLSSIFGKIVIDETGLDEKYDWTFLFDKDKPQTLVNEIEEVGGLKLSLEKRPIKLLIIEKKSK